MPRTKKSTENVELAQQATVTEVNTLQAQLDAIDTLNVPEWQKRNMKMEAVGAVNKLAYVQRPATFKEIKGENIEEGSVRMSLYIRYYNPDKEPNKKGYKNDFIYVNRILRPDQAEFKAFLAGLQKGDRISVWYKPVEVNGRTFNNLFEVFARPVSEQEKERRAEARAEKALAEANI